jgi:hypothetical protein
MTRLQGRSSILHHIHAMLLQHSYKKRRGGKHSRANGRGRKKKKKKTPPQLHASSISLCVCRVCVCVCVCALGWPSWRPPAARAHLAPHTPAGGGWTLVTLMVRVPRVPGPPLRSTRPRRSRSKSGALSGARWVGSVSPCVCVWASWGWAGWVGCAAGTPKNGNVEFACAQRRVGTSDTNYVVSRVPGAKNTRKSDTTTRATHTAHARHHTRTGGPFLHFR